VLDLEVNGAVGDDLVARGSRSPTTSSGGSLKDSATRSRHRPRSQGASQPDRDAQFAYVNDEVTTFVKANEAVISLDTKRKELVGEFSTGGREYHPTGDPTRTTTHDFVDPELGRAVPYGV